MTEPRRDRYIAPGTGPDTAAVMDAAIESLAAARNFEIPDATITLHLLASLLAQTRLPQAVTDARDQGCIWAEIADLLGVTRASAWQRYATRPAPEPNASRHNNTNRPNGDVTPTCLNQHQYQSPHVSPFGERSQGTR